MAVPVFESGTTSTGSGTSTTVTMPSTRPDGDLYVLNFFIDGDEPTKETGAGVLVEPDGWQLIDRTGEGTVTLFTFFRIGDSEPASYTITHTSEVTAAVVTRISGANFIRTTETTGSGANQSAPDHTTVLDETLVLRVIAVDRDNVTATPSTEIAKGGGGGANDVGYGVSYETGPNPAGSTGTAAFTHASDGFAAQTIECLQLPTRPVVESVTTSENTSDATTLTLNMPSTRPDDDLYVVFVAADDTTTIGGAGVHWTNLFNTAHSGGTITAAAWYFSGSSEPASYSITLSTAQQAFGAVFRVSGGEYETFVATASQSDSDGDFTDVTTTSDDTIIIRCVGINDVPIDDAPSLTFDIGETSGTGGVGYAVLYQQGPYPAGINVKALNDFMNSSDDYIETSIVIALAGSAAFNNDIDGVVNAAIANVNTFSIPTDEIQAIQGTT